MGHDTELMYNNFDFEKYIAELKAPWRTMGSDLDTAQAIITKHAKTEMELKTVELMSISDSEHEIEIRFPDWQSEVEKIFIHQYGLNGGKQIFKKVMMRLYLLSKDTAQHVH